MSDSVILPKIYIPEFKLDESLFIDGKNEYYVTDIIKAAENLEIFEMPLVGISLRHSFGDGTVDSFIYHSKRMENANLEYPIILDTTGYICDGWHRIAKAILLGYTKIKAKRLLIMPDRKQ